MSNNTALREIIAELEQLQITREATNQRERQLLARLRAIDEGQQENGRDAAAPVPHQGPGDYARGDYVIITNRLGAAHVFGRRARPSDRAGTVTERTIHPDRVYLTTFNGYRTWRASANVRRISQAEADRIRNDGRP